MTGARSVAAVLHGRLQHLNLPERPPPTGWTAQLPEARAEGPARQAAEAMDERTRTIGEQHAARPQPWIVDRLGMPPAQPGALLEDWITRAGHAGFYRQAAHITDPNTAIGPRPEADPEKAAAWDHAARALNLDTAEHDIRAASRAQLERDVHAYAQAAEAAPPDMGRQIGQHRQAAAELARQAELDQAAGRHQDAAFSRAAATGETRLADRLQPAHETRARWERDHEPQRLAARAARQELNSRGIQPAPEPRQPDAEAADNWQQTPPSRPSPRRRAGQHHRMVAAVHRPGRQGRSRHRRRAPGRRRNRTALATPPGARRARTRTRSQTAHHPAMAAGGRSRTPATSTRHGGRRSRPSRPPASKSRKPHAAKPQPAPSPSPTPKSRSTAPGTTTPKPAPPNPNRSSPRPPNTTTRTRTRPAASTTPGCSHTPDGSPKPTPRPLPDPPHPKHTTPNPTSNPNPYASPYVTRTRTAPYGGQPGEGTLHNGVTVMNAHEWPIVAKCVCYSYCPRFRH